MSTFRTFGRWPTPVNKPAVRDSGHHPETPIEATRPPLPALSLGKVVPAVVDPALLRARDNLDGE